MWFLVRDLRTIIIGMFTVSSTSAPDSCLIHASYTTWDNIYQFRAIEPYFCFLFVVHHWHGTYQHGISVLLWKLCYCDVTVSRHVWEWSGSVGRLIAKRDIPTYSTLINLNQIWHCSKAPHLMIWMHSVEYFEITTQHQLLKSWH